MVPFFNEEAVITEADQRLRLFSSEITNLDVEIIFAKGASQDQTLELIMLLTCQNTALVLTDRTIRIPMLVWNRHPFSQLKRDWIRAHHILPAR